MERAAEKECSALGGLFQLIINDLKMGSPAWEDFLGKATKLHSHLKTTLFALAAFLDAFQKIADLATGARGATKDIGTAMTRLCLRHRSIESKLKIFSSTIMDHLVIPLQERLEEWKKIAYQMDKDHAKEYKRVRQDIKKKSSDTLRLQKKVRKTGKGDMKKTLDTVIQDVNEKYHLLQETEKQAVRRALIEERGRYCLFVSCLRPVVESELATVHEVSHLQEVLDALAKLTEDPNILPSTSEQVITDVKSTDGAWSFQTPPSSPTSLGSRKSSVCSISSMNSSSGDSTKSYSPSHHRSRSLSQQLPTGALRLLSVSSQDSGFTSQDTLFTRPATPPPLEVTNQALEFSMGITGNDPNACAGGTSPSFPPPPSVTATWPNLQDTEQFERAAASIVKSQRPHTISTAYERHQRPSLTTQTFQPKSIDGQERDTISDSAGTLTSTCSDETKTDFAEEQSDNEEYGDDVTPTHKPSTPPLPPRCTDLDRVRPKIPQKPNILKQHVVRSPSSLTSPVIASGGTFDPVYANSSDLGPQPEKLTTASKTQDGGQEKTVFPSDLAAAVAQKALQQKQYRATLGHRSKVSVLNQLITQNVAVDSGESQKVEPAVPPKPPPYSDRRFSLPGPVPNLLPPKPSADSFKKSSVIQEKETSWNVFTDSNDSSAAHSQLMQALNARLSVLQQQTTEPSGKQHPSVENRRFSTVVDPIPDQELIDNAPQRRHPPAHPQRKPRAHSIGGTDREAFLNTLNSKFAQMHEQSPSQTSPKKLNASEATTPVAPPPKDSFARMDHIDSRSYAETGGCQHIPSFDSSRSKVNNTPPSLFPTVSNVTIQQRVARQDRRHSVNIDADCGNRLQTFFSPSANSKLMNDQQLDMGMDPSCGMMSDAAARVQTWLSGRGSVDARQCRSSLLGQIRQGINLRKAPQINDRSAPLFQHF